MKTTLTAEDWKKLDKQITIGETIGILLGQLGGNMILSIRHPVIGVSELARSAGGFCTGFADGITISRCNFEKRLVTKDYLTVNKTGKAIKNGFSKLSEKTQKAFTRLQQLPQDIQDEIMSEQEEAITT